MSKFSVEIRSIEKVIKHPNADRLFVYSITGSTYQFISSVHYEVGNEIVYFPIDSVLPEHLISEFQLGTMLAGKSHNRVKTIRLRGEISQGFVANIDSVADILGITIEQLKNLGDGLTEALGVVKWEPPAVPCHNGDLIPLPLSNSVYDIEACDNYPHIVQWLIDNQISVVVTEKLEGQNFSVTVTKDGDEFVSQRRYSIREKDGGEHDMWEVARREKILEIARKILLGEKAEDVTLYGEHLGPGIQGNYYKLEKRTVRFFDLKINNQWVGATNLRLLLDQYGGYDQLVPVYWIDGPLDRYLQVVGAKTIQEASHGKSVLHKERLREGIVIRPTEELQDHPFIKEIGQHFIIKQRDPIYLTKTDN